MKRSKRFKKMLLFHCEIEPKQRIVDTRPWTLLALYLDSSHVHVLKIYPRVCTTGYGDLRPPTPTRILRQQLLPWALFPTIIAHCVVCLHYPISIASFSLSLLTFRTSYSYLPSTVSPILTFHVLFHMLFHVLSYALFNALSHVLSTSRSTVFILMRIKMGSNLKTTT